MQSLELLCEDNSAKPQLKTSWAVTFNLNTKQNDDPESKMAENITTQVAGPLQPESYHEMMKRQQRRLHSWPSREGMILKMMKMTFLIDSEDACT